MIHRSSPDRDDGGRGDKEILYFKDFASGAMIESIVRRAKKLALKRYIANGPKGVTDDWAKIAGRKAERIISEKTLTSEAPSQPRNVERVGATGQYL